MRPYPITVLQGGINRLRVKGGAAANMLYDLQNGYITNAGSIVPREGTIRSATLNSSTVGLAALNGKFNVFAVSTVLQAPVQSAILTTSTGGTLTTATYYYEVTALNALGETTASNERSVLTTGTTSSNLIVWGAVPGALTYRIYRGTAAAGENVYYTTGSTSFLDIGAANTGGTPPIVNGTGIAVPSGYTLNVLTNPVTTTATPTTIWFAKPFMGFLYVVAQFSDNNIFHYWLQSNGTWTSNTVYKTGNIELPSPVNGLAYQAVRDFPPNPPWSANSVISAGTIIEPTQYTGFAYEAVSVASDQGSQSGISPVLLLHMDGANGQTTTLDSSPNANPVIINNGSLSTSNPKFGSAAFATTGVNLFGSYALGVPFSTGSPVDIFATTEWTIDCWVLMTTTGGSMNFCDYGGSLTGGVTSDLVLSCGISGGTLTVSAADQAAFGTGATISTTSAGAVNTWHHVALISHAGIQKLYVDGVAAGNTRNDWMPSNYGAAGVKNVVVGSYSRFNGATTPGMVDEFRVTRSALWTANFNTALPAAPATVVTDAHTGSTEPVWPTVSAATIQEFGDFNASSTNAGATQATTTSASAPLGKNITDRYGNSSTVANAGVAPTSALSLPVIASTNVTTWAPGTLYAPGAVVRPTATQGAFINAIPNGDFENGNDGNWTFSGVTPWAFSNTGAYQGNWCLSFPTGNTSPGGDFATMTNFGIVVPGQSVTASVYLNPNNNGADLDAWIQLNWYDATDTFLSATVGPHQEGGGYRQASVTGNAPPKAAHCRVSIGAGSGTNSRNTGYADLAVWNLEQPATVSNFLYEAVQVAAGSSATAQPVWPTTQGSVVIDGGVTWKAIGTSIITWEAIPLMLSGTIQPTFPTTVGLSVNDPSTFTDINGTVINTHMSWQCISRQITDPKCPNTIAVTLGASHVFAGDKDLVDFSAAVDPTDWHSANNAGYLPTGLNNYGDNPVAMLALYRSNLMAFNAGGYQMWQIDPDPANMALLDAQPVGSIYPRAAQSVANDLLFLTEVGVRNLGTVGATANMQVGNTGQPVDPLVIAQLKGVSNSTAFKVTCGIVTTPTGLGNFQNAGLPNGGGGYIIAGLPASGFNSITTGGSITPANFGVIPVAGAAGNNGAGVVNNTDLYLYFTGNIPQAALVSMSGVDIAGNPYTALGVNAQVSTSAGYTQFYWQNATTDFPFPKSGTTEIILTGPPGTPLTPISLYYPGRGQYWLFFGSQAFVLTLNGAGQKSWSRYLFPDTITDWTLNAGILYLRTAGNLVWQFDANTLVDDSGGNNTVFNGVLQWPYLDMGELGINKMLGGVDIVGDGDVIIQLGFEQADKTTFNDNAGFPTSTNVTAPYTVAIADTVPGMPLPIPINAPSYSLILTFPGGQQWTWQAANLYVVDVRGAGATG
jgi:hypothetical protein